MIALVAHTVKASTGGNAVTTDAIDTSGANLLVVAVADYQPMTHSTLSDSKSNIWTALTPRTLVGSVYQQLWYCLGATVGSGHTFSTDQSNFPAIVVTAWSGAKTSAAKDQEGGTTALATATFTEPSQTPSEDNELVIAIVSSDTAGSMTIDSGYTISDKSEFDSGDSFGVGMAYKIQTSAAATSPVWSFGVTAAATAGSIVTFKSEAGGGGGGGDLPTGIVQYIGTQISSGDYSGYAKSKAFDNDFSTAWAASTADGGWIGIDLGTAAIPYSWGMAAPINVNGNDYSESRPCGGILRGSSAADFASSNTTWDELPLVTEAGFLGPREIHVRQIYPDVSKRYWSFAGANGSYGGGLAEFRLFGAAVAGVTCKPCPPVISPASAACISGTSPTITITCPTTSASIYYTTDGTAPTTGSTLYSAPFTFSVGTNAQVRAIASDANATTTLSEECVPARFRNYGYKPNDAQYDAMTGNLLEIHNASIVEFPTGSGIFVMMTNTANGTGAAWTDYIGRHGLDILVGLPSADGKTVDWVNYGNVIAPVPGFDFLIRPSLLINQDGDLTLWAHAYNLPPGGGDRAWRWICPGDSDPTDPESWTSAGALDPDGLGCKDMSRCEFQGEGYLLYTGGLQNAIYISKMAGDYMSTTGDYIVLPGTGSTAAEGMCGFEFNDNGTFKLGVIYCNVANYYDSTSTYDMKTVVTTEPLAPGSYSSPVDVFASSPLGTDYNGQNMSCWIVPNKVNGIVMLADFWVATDEYASRPVWLPVDVSSGVPVATVPASWDLSTFDDVETDPVPSAPQVIADAGLQAAPTSRINYLSWVPVAGATNYKVYISADNVTYSLLATVGAVTTYSHTLPNPYDPSKWYYKITSVVAGVESAKSSAVHIPVFYTFFHPNQTPYQGASVLRIGASFVVSWVEASFHADGSGNVKLEVNYNGAGWSTLYNDVDDLGFTWTVADHRGPAQFRVSDPSFPNTASTTDFTISPATPAGSGGLQSMMGVA